MMSRKTLKSKDGFTLVEVTDDDGGVSYEIYDSQEELLDSFSTLEEAESYL